jgi:AraC family transcriptional regulator, regulatory protein of adaptative response / DNA-3-methyladenine glycosylase II
VGYPDAFPASDLGLRRALEALGHLDVSARVAESLSDRWRPWRSLAATHLWFSLGVATPRLAPVVQPSS